MPHDRHHLFVSYASVDNKPLEEIGQGWLTQLIRHLKNLVDARLGRSGAFKFWMDYELSGNDAITPAILNELQKSDTILLVLTPGYLLSGWCQKELSTFLGQHNIDSKRVFVVEPDKIEAPEALQDLKGYRFYTTTPEGKTKRLGWPKAQPDQQTYFDKITDLAHDITDKISEITAEPGNTGQLTAPEHTVLLAPVSNDLTEAREQMCRYLQQQNILVLPESGGYRLPTLQEQMLADLERADLYVQLLSTDPAMGTTVYQHECATQGGKPILLWHPLGLDPATVKDQRHAALLRDDRLIVSDLLELQL